MYRLQFTGDTLENWMKNDPVLLNREMALVASDSDSPKVYDLRKVGDGVHRFSELPMLGFDCVQETGDSTLFPMSQKAVTDELARMEAKTVLIPESEFNELYESGRLDPEKTYHTYQP